MLSSLFQLPPPVASLVALLVAFAIVIALAPKTIAWLRHRKIGDNPDFDRADMNAMMADKRGTPTMGGVLIVAALAASAMLVAPLASPSLWLALVTLLSYAGVGAVDDWLKLNKQRRAAAGGAAASRQGLSGGQKLLIQLAVGALVAWLMLRFDGAGHRVAVPFARASIPLPPWLFVIWGTLVITGASDSVNLTDGLDGLASGCVTIASAVFLIAALLAGNVVVAVLCAAAIGACLGFLWFNCHPARVFMGDTGSLALGGLLGFVALSLRLELLLVIVGFVFVAEALSVMLQVYYFKYTRIRFGEGRRIFRMSPLHHHFQKCGWSEPQVVVRFWIAAALLAAIGLAALAAR